MLSLPTPVYLICTGVPKQAVAPTERHTHAKLEYMMAVCIVYTGQASLNLPDLCLKWGEFNFAGWAIMPGKLKKSPPPKAQVWGVHASLT